MADLDAKKQAFRFQSELPEDIDTMRQLLTSYSKIPPQDVDSHILEIRSKAWKIHPYPCIGRFTFLQLGIVRTEAYKTAVRRLTAGGEEEEALLDLGCCFGQVLRQLVSDGVAPQRLYGADLHQEFIDLGYELFRDKPDEAGLTFVTGDLLDAEADAASSSYSVLEGKMTIVQAANFFHLFGWEQQVVAVVRIIGFLRRSTNKDEKLAVFGTHIGSAEAGERVLLAGSSGNKRYLHDGASFQKLWDEAGRQTNTQWKTTVDVVQQGLAGSALDPTGKLQYVRYAVYWAE